MNFINNLINSVSNMITTTEIPSKKTILVSLSIGIASLLIYKGIKIIIIANKKDKKIILKKKLPPKTPFIDYPVDIQKDAFIRIRYLEEYPLFFEINSKKISYNIFGDKNGFPILHFHGSGGCIFEGLAYHKKAVEYGFKVILMDRPGHGRSTLVDGYSLKDYANDLVAFLKYLKIDNVILSGSSQGGIYAISLIPHLTKHSINLKCINIFAGLPILDLSDFGSDTYKNAIPPNFIQQQTTAVNHPLLNSFFTNLFLFYLKYSNNNNPSPNYNAALEYLITLKIMSKQDIIEVNKPIENCINNNGIKLNGFWFSKEMAKYSYKIYGMKGEQWTMLMQQNKGFKLCNINTDIKIFWVHGKEDKIIPIDFVKGYQNMLINDCGVDIDMCEIDNYGHFMFNDDNIDINYKKIRELLDKSN